MSTNNPPVTMRNGQPVVREITTSVRATFPGDTTAQTLQLQITEYALADGSRPIIMQLGNKLDDGSGKIPEDARRITISLRSRESLNLGIGKIDMDAKKSDREMANGLPNQALVNALLRAWDASATNNNTLSPDDLESLLTVVRLGAELALNVTTPEPNRSLRQTIQLPAAASPVTSQSAAPPARPQAASPVANAVAAPAERAKLVPNALSNEDFQQIASAIATRKTISIGGVEFDGSKRFDKKEFTKFFEQTKEPDPRSNVIFGYTLVPKLDHDNDSLRQIFGLLTRKDDRGNMRALDTHDQKIARLAQAILQTEGLDFGKLGEMAEAVNVACKATPAKGAEILLKSTTACARNR